MDTPVAPHGVGGAHRLPGQLGQRDLDRGRGQVRLCLHQWSLTFLDGFDPTDRVLAHQGGPRFINLCRHLR
jgi:hypothetical protein